MKKLGSGLILLLCFLVSIGQLATVIYLPSMPAIAHELSASPTQTELTLTLYMLAFGLSQLIYGPISDLVGRKYVMLVAALVYIVGSIMSATAPLISVLLLARFIEGFGAGGITSLARAANNDLFTGHKLTKALTYTSIAASLASMLSPTLGGFIQEYTVWRVNFWFLTAYALFFMILAYFFFPNFKPKIKNTGSILSHFINRYKEVLLHRHYLGYTLCAAFSFAGITTYYVASPFIYQHQLHLSPSAYGMLFLATSGGYILGGFFNNYFPLDDLRRFRLGSTLTVIAISAMLILAYCGFFNIYVIFIPFTLYMFGTAIVFTTGMASAVRLFRHIAGTAAAMLGCIQIVSASIGTAIMAHLPQFNQIPMAWMLLTITLAVFSIAFFMIKKHS